MQSLTAQQSILKKAGEHTAQTLKILQSFESRLSDLEQKMSPIHAVTTSLNAAYDNIGLAMDAVDSTLSHFRLYEEVETLIMRQGIAAFRQDYEPYLKTVDRIYRSAVFLNQHKNYVTAEKQVVKLKKLLQHALKDTDNEFRLEMTKHSTAIDPHKLTWPLNAKLEPMPQPAIENLRKLSSRLQQAGSPEGYQQVYIEQRQQVLDKSIAYLQPERMTDERPAAAGSLKDIVFRYERGSHKFNMFIVFLLRLLQAERALALDIVDPITHVVEDVYWQVIEGSVEEFATTGERLVKAYRTPDRVAVLFDVLQTLEANMAAFDEVLRNSSSKTNSVEIPKLVLEITKAAKQVFADMVQSVADDPPGKPVPTATVHPLTTIVMQRLTRLLEYKEAVERLLPRVDSTAEARTALGVYIVNVLRALEGNLEMKAKQYGAKQAMATCVFLLNNYHYILKSVRDRDMLNDVGTTVVNYYERLVSKQMANYSQSWKKALEIITENLPVAPPGKPLTRGEKQAIKDRFKNFNTAFDDAFQLQSRLSIPDSELRARVQRENRGTILEPYARFADRYVRTQFTENVNKYIKYKQDSLAAALDQFFLGLVKS
eukprot:TRINITY_DN4906_c0_g1_i2.p1 TRINITY_DN4906_c0_g1~~TRINITY_DN4906_c0_g1_i2.p1  ORF type:complete len:599 (-),score=161.07 TRINITY_DN4906_c0_g1_i2:1079-2875(-)